MNIDKNFFDSMLNHIYPSELQLNKANVTYCEAQFLDLHLSLSNGFVNLRLKLTINFDYVNYPFLDGDVVFMFLSLFDLLEGTVMLMTLILVIRF